jgi:hypothetical protein
MFHVEPVKGVEKQKPPKAAGSAWCPACPSRKVGLGVLNVNGHVVYREHTKKTYSGATVTCPASGVRLCHLLPYDKHDTKFVRCICMGDPRTWA